MSDFYNLETLKADLDREFAPMKLTIGDDELVLRNLMRINPTEREAVMGALEKVQDHQDKENDEDRQVSPEELAALSDAVEVILEKVTADGKGEKLVKAIGGDLALSMKLMEAWSEATQPGEAQNSPA